MMWAFPPPATHRLRFCREYFKPKADSEVEKDRRRWLVRFRGKEFFVNLDYLLKPVGDHTHLEIKSRTWS